jgi:hypothetical protein
MIHIHATQKLLATSRIDSVMLVTEQTADQQMHNWYATLISSGYQGKTFVLYFHEPSMLMVITKGRTIATTYASFRERLKKLLHRLEFPADFIEREILLTETHVTGKTSNRSMLSVINQSMYMIDWKFRMFEAYDLIDSDEIEDLQMGLMFSIRGKGYTTPHDFWQNALGCKLHKRPKF